MSSEHFAMVMWNYINEHGSEIADLESIKKEVKQENGKSPSL